MDNEKTWVIVPIRLHPAQYKKIKRKKKETESIAHFIRNLVDNVS